ncbi:hypothetical protein J2X46_000255 [Nocardioides sp. BE266]|uniref:hypothetical protein n=1 Tax=Nocardioides sp. BE266 TaxID=2817725 RepID=UPI00286718F9|nr:hypothetical protein [Nocardioides sp. BE266]MDR7251283.1 hypothetical protein [Nocardioides sp. BE266]
MTPAAQRVVGIVVLLVLGGLVWPVTAFFFDDHENWLIPIGLFAAMAIGAAATIGLPALARAGASTGRRALTGAWWGLLASFAGIAVFWFLLNGLGGA